MSKLARRNALNSTDANLLWLHLDGNLAKARSILLDAELQAAVIASAGYGPTGSHTNQISDPTGEAAMTEAGTVLRANAITSAWLMDYRECLSVVRWIRRRAHDALDMEPPRPRPANLARALRDLRALAIVPHDLSHRAAETMEGEALREYDAAHETAYNLATRIRFGAPSIGNSPAIPGVSNVIEAARRITEAAPPKPKSKPLQGCVSCKRDNDHFEPIDPRYSAKYLCRVCGDFNSGEGCWPPVGAVEYVHRTGKRLTWKVIEDAKRNDRRKAG
jgi:hypothetical protein